MGRGRGGSAFRSGGGRWFDGWCPHAGAEPKLREHVPLIDDALRRCSHMF